MIGIYFSGTGNSKYVLEKFMLELNEEQIYALENINHSIIEKNDEIIFSYPTYYSNLPKIVFDFIVNNANLWKNKKIFIINTMGLFSGDGAGICGRLFKKYKAYITGGLHVKMPDCIGDVKILKTSKEKNKLVILKANKKLCRAAKKYKSNPTQNGLSILSRILGLFGQRLYFKGKVKTYTQNPKISNSCIGCGKCSQICPMKNISIVNKKAVSGDRCTLCYRCYVNCPSQSITIIGKRVYQQIKIEDFL